MNAARLIPGSLYSRLASAFSLIALGLMALQFSLLYLSWTRADQEAQQRLSEDVAAAVVREVLPLAAGGDLEKLAVEFSRIRELNPHIDVYLLDSSGTAMPAGGRHLPWKVNPAVLEEYIRPQVSRKLPLYGVDLRSEMRPVTFSAARFSWAGQPAYIYVILDSSRRKIFRQAVTDWYIVSRGGVTSIVILMCYLLAGALVFSRITRRFSSLAKAVDRIAQGELKARVDARGNDEIGRLGQQINDMADKIESNIAALQERDRIRRDLTANISHDLRGPIAALRAALESMLERLSSMTDADKEQRLRFALAGTDRLGAFVSQLFELSKLEAKEVQASPEYFSILDVISEEIIPNFTAAAAGRGISLVARLPEHCPNVFADLEMTYRVLANLVDNALRCTGAGGEVIVAASPAGEKVHISVSDTGRGMAPDELERIFDRFYSAEKLDSTSSSGSGLGLTIVKRLLVLQGADISVESTPGTGSLFSFHLPAAAAQN